MPRVGRSRGLRRQTFRPGVKVRRLRIKEVEIGGKVGIERGLPTGTIEVKAMFRPHATERTKPSE